MPDYFLSAAVLHNTACF